MARTPDPSEAEFVRRVRELRPQSAEPGRHRARRAAMMLLYRADLLKGDVGEAIDGFASEHGFAMPAYGAELARGVDARDAELDERIGGLLEGWTLDRLGAVERAILRIGMHELEAGEVPPPVVIDEAVELAKRYASPDAAKLVNGVLAGWLRTHGAADQLVPTPGSEEEE